MVKVNTGVLETRIHDTFNLKSHKIIKKKISKLYSLDKFIVICSPFIFDKIFVKRKQSGKFSKGTIIIFIKESLKIIKFIYKCLLNQIFVNQIKIEDKIFFFSNRFTDQHNIFPISNYLLEKNVRHTLLFNGQQNVLHKIKKKFKKKIFQIQNYLNISDLFYGYINFLKKKHEIKKLFNIFNFNKDEKKIIFNFFRFFFIYQEIYKRIIKTKEIKFVLSDKFNSPEICSLIDYLKFKKGNKKFLAISYAYIGLGGESATYIYSNSDHILTTSKDDNEVLNLLRKKKLLFLTTPTQTAVGSVRNETIKKKYFKKKSKKINILYIKSNSHHYNNIDDKALKIFIKVIRKFKSDINFKIKDRYNSKSQIIKQMLSHGLIKKKNVVNDNEAFVEKSIINSDICVGTCSSALTVQCFWLKRPIIQMFKNKLVDSFKNSMSANTEKELEFILNKLLNKKFLKMKKDNANKIYKDLYLIKQSPIHNIYKYIKNITY